MNENHNIDQDRRLDRVESHIETTNKEMGEIRDNIADVKIDVAKVKTDVCWLKRFFWIIAGSSIGGLIAAIINLIRG